MNIGLFSYFLPWLGAAITEIVLLCLNLLPIVLIVAIVFGCAKLAKRRWGETVLLIMLTLLLPLTAGRFADISFKDCSRRHNMETALKHCGTMIKEERTEELHQKLAALLASEEYRTADAYGLSVAFRAAVSEKDAWREALVRERRRSMGRGAAIGMAIWLPLAVVWWVLYAKVRTSKPRRIYLAILLTLTSAALFLMFVAHAVGNGYSRSGYKWDIDKLAAYLEQPALPPELLPMLETPQASGFSYLRQLPPPEK